MKIMYVDHSIEGHHLEYLKNLAGQKSYESFAVLPQQVENLEIRQIAYTQLDLKKKKLGDYLKYMKALKRIAMEEKPDVIHFLDGDSTMRYFHLGYRYFKGFRTVVTFHHLFPGKVRELSMKVILSHVSTAVVHTDEIKEKIIGYGCQNVVCIHYPCFLNLKSDSEKRNDPKTLLALGGTRFDKGLDILLEALKTVRADFRLIVAGKEEFFSREYIGHAVLEYCERVELKLKFLSNEEVIECLSQTDIIVLPYRKEFDGASGPMCEGAYLGKMIIGPEHGSLGSMIRKNHLGYVFRSEDREDLSKVLEKALREEFIYDETARAYQNSLAPEVFLQKHAELYSSL